jgi:hypothetical protein
MIFPPPPVADRVQILTTAFRDDVHLKAWAARLIAAAEEFQRNKRPDPLGRLYSEMARFPRRVVRLGQVFVLGPQSRTWSGRTLERGTKGAVLRYPGKSQAGSDAIPSYHKAIRLQRLDAMIMTAIERGNVPLAAQLLEQAVKESGGAFTNKHQQRKACQGSSATPAAQVTIFQLPDNGGG